MTNRDGRTTNTAPKVKFVIKGDKLTIEPVGKDKPPKYASNLYRTIEK